MSIFEFRTDAYKGRGAYSGKLGNKKTESITVIGYCICLTINLNEILILIAIHIGYILSVVWCPHSQKKLNFYCKMSYDCLTICDKCVFLKKKSEYTCISVFKSLCTECTTNPLGTDYFITLFKEWFRIHYYSLATEVVYARWDWWTNWQHSSGALTWTPSSNSSRPKIANGRSHCSP